MIYVHLSDGFEEVEALAVVDVLRRGGVDVATISMTGHETVTSVHNISIKADLLYEEADYEHCEMIVLPGGIPGTAGLRSHQGLRRQLKCFSKQGKYIAAICAAPTILGELNILNGRKATSYPGMEVQLLDALYSSASVVIDGNLITSRGPGTAFEFGLAILQVLKGKAIEKEVRKKLIM